ncbi:MAG TPA: hypothetical protein VJ836_07365 [Candidatus Saccharimonadales bacterium]|nr:hypothetical protein [Candidatus Saccharimonadales bacterium]
MEIWRQHLEAAHARVQLEAYTNYLEQPKLPGLVAPTELMELARLMQMTGRPELLECAASAIEEALLFSPRTDLDTLDADLDLVDYAATLRERAIQAYETNTPNGPQLPVLQARLDNTYPVVHKDFICGELTDMTRLEVTQQLRGIGQKTVELIHDGNDFERHDLLSFALKIGIAMTAMTGRGDIVMLPAPMRARRISSHDNNHHDFLFIYGNTKGPMSVIPAMLVTPFSRKTVMPDPQSVVILDVQRQVELTVPHLETLYSPDRTLAATIPLLSSLHDRLLVALAAEKRYLK